ncbi:hypothetical protein [Haliangium sp.]|uniref:hypothetical protein n=1 Tax=Haliangium sp. TaxID=2663208 RepID=UPI003D143648
MNRTLLEFGDIGDEEDGFGDISDGGNRQPSKLRDPNIRGSLTLEHIPHGGAPIHRAQSPPNTRPGQTSQLGQQANVSALAQGARGSDAANVSDE